MKNQYENLKEFLRNRNLPEEDLEICAEIVVLLKKRPRGMNISKITEELKQPKGKISNALKSLRTAGVVGVDKIRPSHVHYLLPEILDILRREKENIVKLKNLK